MDIGGKRAFAENVDCSILLSMVNTNRKSMSCPGYTSWTTKPKQDGAGASFVRTWRAWRSCAMPSNRHTYHQRIVEEAKPADASHAETGHGRNRCRYDAGELNATARRGHALVDEAVALLRSVEDLSVRESEHACEKKPARKSALRWKPPHSSVS